MDPAHTDSALQNLPSRLKPRPAPIEVGGEVSRPRQTSPATENLIPGRASFSSVREADSNLTQAFTSTSVSSFYIQDSENESDNAVEEAQPSPSTDFNMATEFMTPLTQPHSRLHGTWFPAAAEGFRGWKQIDVRGRPASRSFGDLQRLRMVWESPASTPTPVRTAALPVPGSSPLESLPNELKIEIVRHLILDIPPEGFKRRNADLMAMLCVSRTMHASTLVALYQNITIPHSRIFRKFLDHLSNNPGLWSIPRRLDFSHFNPTALFTTAAERATTRNLTSETLLQSLRIMPRLREFLAQDYIDDDINADVLRKLLYPPPVKKQDIDPPEELSLEALDFCGCSSAGFRAAFETILADEWPETLTIQRLSFHRCMSLPSAVFQKILPRLTRLTHLDLAGTRVTDDALLSIPTTARITHLNLAKCNALTSEAVIRFIQQHPAVQHLVFLSLASDYRSHELLNKEDVYRLIPVLPKTLRSLSLKGNKMETDHIPMLRPLTMHLEELALGRGLKLEDVSRLFFPDPDTEQAAWAPHNLKYLDLSDYTLNSLSTAVLFSKASLLKGPAEPLQVIEFAEDVYKKLSSTTAATRAGWRLTDLGSRSWLVRDCAGNGAHDPGYRNWKMGAAFWGMRKIPVAVSNVGGMYGSYMFKRHL